MAENNKGRCRHVWRARHEPGYPGRASNARLPLGRQKEYDADY